MRDLNAVDEEKDEGEGGARKVRSNPAMFNGLATHPGGVEILLVASCF